MSAINVNSITGRTGTHGPVLTGVTTATNGLNVTGGNVGIGIDDPQYKIHVRDANGSVVSIDRSNNLANKDFIAGLRFGNNDSSGSPPHGTGVIVIA